MLGGRPGFYIDITGIHLDGAEGDGFTLKKEHVGCICLRKITLDYCDLRIIPSDEFAIESAGRQKGQAGDPGEGRRTAFEGEGGKGCGSAFYVLFGFSDLEESYLNLYVPE